MQVAPTSFFTLIKSTKASKNYLEARECPSRRVSAQEADVRKLVMSGLCNGRARSARLRIRCPDSSKSGGIVTTLLRVERVNRAIINRSGVVPQLAWGEVPTFAALGACSTSVDFDIFSISCLSLYP
jgi:hypothetical protein